MGNKKSEHSPDGKTSSPDGKTSSPDAPSLWCLNIVDPVPIQDTFFKKVPFQDKKFRLLTNTLGGHRG